VRVAACGRTCTKRDRLAMLLQAQLTGKIESTLQPCQRES
jgi:hypothetical protein